MTVNDFAKLVLKMRAAQRKYFGYRTTENLNIAKDLEKQVDTALEKYFGKAEKVQPGLDL